MSKQPFYKTPLGIMTAALAAVIIGVVWIEFSPDDEAERVLPGQLEQLTLLTYQRFRADKDEKSAAKKKKKKAQSKQAAKKKKKQGKTKVALFDELDELQSYRIEFSRATFADTSGQKVGIDDLEKMAFSHAPEFLSKRKRDYDRLAGTIYLSPKKTSMDSQPADQKPAAKEKAKQKEQAASTKPGAKVSSQIMAAVEGLFEWKVKPEKTFDLKSAAENSRQHKSVKDLKKFLGLDQPAEQIKLELQELGQITILIGDREAGKTGYYAQIRGDETRPQSTIYIIPTHIIRRFRQKQNRATLLNLVPVNKDLVDRIEIEIDSAHIDRSFWLREPRKPIPPGVAIKGVKLEELNEKYKKALTEYDKQMEEYKAKEAGMGERVQLVFQKVEHIKETKKGQSARVVWEIVESQGLTVDQKKIQTPLSRILQLKAVGEFSQLKSDFIGLVPPGQDCTMKVRLKTTQKGGSRKVVLREACIGKPIPAERPFAIMSVDGIKYVVESKKLSSWVR